MDKKEILNSIKTVITKNSERVDLYELHPTRPVQSTLQEKDPFLNWKVVKCGISYAQAREMCQENSIHNVYKIDYSDRYRLVWNKEFAPITEKELLKTLLELHQYYEHPKDETSGWYD
jgi:hypothetical protein